MIIIRKKLKKKSKKDPIYCWIKYIISTPSSQDPKDICIKLIEKSQIFRVIASI
jgi:hypothetical protein